MRARRVWRAGLSGAIGAASLALGGVVACGSGGWNDLTGGSRDAAPAPEAGPPPPPGAGAPRPIAPLSFSAVRSSRPRLRLAWGDPFVGAVVELCRTRACDAIARSYPVTTRTFDVPDDLEAGVWFWRLRGRAEGGAVSDKTSPTWQMLVRGPAPKGSSPHGSGALVDVDGDGQVDLLATAHGGGRSALLVHRAGPAGLPAAPSQVIELFGIARSIAAGTDLDGDGFGDVVVVTEDSFEDADAGRATFRDAVVLLGSPDGLKAAARRPLLPAPLRLGAIVREAGDVDGDGYGDLLATGDGAAFVLFGGPGGPTGALAPLTSDTATPPDDERVFVGALDTNGDGVIDLGAGTGRVDGPASLLLGRAGAVPTTSLALEGGGARLLPHAIAITGLDMNGDGQDDLAFSASQSVPDPGEPLLELVCISVGPPPLLQSLGCGADAVDTHFGDGLAGADVDGDGQDELLVASTYGVDVVRYGSAGAVDVDPDAPILRRALTVTTMRPSLGTTPARWAAALLGIAPAKAPSNVVIVEGKRRVQYLRAPLPLEIDGPIR